MAAAPDPDEVLRSKAGKDNFQRVTRLLIAGATSLLREIFDTYCPPSNLPTMLSNPVTQKQLKAAKLTKPQWDCLYPFPGVHGKSTDFDVTLLFRLLRTICGLARPATGWDVLPPSFDHSVTAELARIKYYRNSVYVHVNQSMEVTDDEFPSLWEEISGALVRIAGQISLSRKREWQRTVENFLKDPLTLEDERNAQELERWYKDDMEIKESIERLNSAAKEVREGIERSEKGSAQIHEALDSLSSSTTSTQSAGVRLRLRIDCETIIGRDTQQEATRSLTTLHEPHTVAQGAATVAQAASLPTNFGKRNIPSMEVKKSIEHLNTATKEVREVTEELCKGIQRFGAAPDPEEVLRSKAAKGNFQRVTRLLIAGGTSFLREIFDTLCPPSNLPIMLRNPVTQKQLKAAKLTKPQWDCLYPSPGVYGKSTDFDVTLLFRLLRTICGLAPPATGWDVLPPSSDHSLTAELARIKYFRNSVYGHVNQSMEVTDDEFPSLWQEISGALVSIAGQISPAKRREWQRTVDKFLKDPLTLEDEKNAQELDRWYRDDVEIKEYIERLNSSTKEVREAIERLEKGSAQTPQEALDRLSSSTASTQSAGGRSVSK